MTSRPTQLCRMTPDAAGAKPPFGVQSVITGVEPVTPAAGDGRSEPM